MNSACAASRLIGHGARRRCQRSSPSCPSTRSIAGILLTSKTISKARYVPTSPVRLPMKVAAPPAARNSAAVSSVIASAVTAPNPAPASTSPARASGGRGPWGCGSAGRRLLPGRDPAATTESKPTDGNTPKASWPGGERLLCAPSERGPRALKAGRTPDREPPAQVSLDGQVRPDVAAYLEFQRVVAVLAGLRRERVERPPLVEVDDAQLAAGGIGEPHQRAQQLRAEPAFRERDVDRVQVGDQRLHVVGGVP